MEAKRYIFILGSHPDLSAAEAWNVLEREGYTPKLIYLDQNGLEVVLDRELEETTWTRMGGSERVLETETELSSQAKVEDIVKAILPQGSLKSKLTAGISGIGISKDELGRIGHALKVQAREVGLKLKFVLPQKHMQLNAAQAIFNHLDTAPNFELWVWRRKDKMIVAKMKWVQDIERYEIRDTARPARDAVVGMLPPKLAQMMINVAHGGKPSAEVDCFDPFCGMGTVLQEGWLMGFQMTGTDAADNMVTASEDNLNWVGDKLLLPTSLRPYVVQHDATLPYPDEWKEKFTAIVSEPFLGRPLRSPLPYRELKRHMQPLMSLYLKSFENWHSCLKTGGTVVLALPAFRAQRRGAGFNTLSDAFLDAVRELGYSEQHLLSDPLNKALEGRREGAPIYARPTALVGREIRKWQKM
jgi:tRNA G10  N-methylase Trm11